MNLFEVYKLWDIEPVKGLDTTLWDKDGAVYTDLYGGHAVISVGHSHPHYVKMISDQLGKLGEQSRCVRDNLRGVDGVFRRQLRKNFERAEQIIFYTAEFGVLFIMTLLFDVCC